LDILITQGLFGFGIYLLALIVIIKTLISFYRKDNTKLEYPIFLCLIISVFVANSFSFFISVDNILFLGLLAIILNKTYNFKERKISLSPKTLFITGIIFSFITMISVRSINMVYANNAFMNGINNLYEDKINDGVSNLQKAISLNPHQDTLYFLFSDMLLLIGKENSLPAFINQANETIEYAGSYTNYCFRYHLTKGKIESALKDYKRAEREFNLANELAPTNPLVLREWGTMYYENKNCNEAIAKIEEALSLMPDIWKWKIKTEPLTKENKERFRLYFKDIQDFWEIFPYLRDCYKQKNDIEKSEYYGLFAK
jgi:tetratricopeptide (TPR) repeat protein